ncbi:MAG: secretin N-terminal domain-containing protein [Thermoanaerobaculales bacterium]
MWRRVFLIPLVVAAAAVAASAAEVETVVRIFRLHHVSVMEVSKAIEPLLSEHGSLTVQPRQSRISVQDRPPVVERVAQLIEEMDRRPESYRIQVELLEGSSKALEPEQVVDVDERMRNMFRFKAYRRLGAAIIEGELGSPATADLGGGFKLSFVAEAVAFSEQTPWGARDPGNRVHIRDFILEKIKELEDGSQKAREVLSTSIFLAPRQKVFIGAGQSESAKTGLVLIVNAQEIGGS